jgi:hypothetical protein
MDSPPGSLRTNPELNMMRSWAAFLSEERRAAEASLGYKPDQLAKKFWTTDGYAADKLLAVDKSSDEFAAVKAIFLSEPVVPAFYKFGSAGSSWAQRARVLSISRVENSGQEGSSRATYKNIDAALKSEGVAFMGGVHSRWLFHGTDHETVLKIVNNPIDGFNALASQRALWGVGINLARDASYSDAGFSCVGADGSKHMVLCLVMTGSSCLGFHSALLHQTKRDGNWTYNSFVDSLSNPEIFVVDVDGLGERVNAVRCSDTAGPLPGRPRTRLICAASRRFRTQVTVSSGFSGRLQDAAVSAREGICTIV